MAGQQVTCLPDNRRLPILLGVPTIGENIRNARISAGVRTQTELAKRLDVLPSRVSEWDNGRYKAPDLKTLLRIAAASPCPLDALVSGIDSEYDKLHAVPVSGDLIRHGGTGKGTPHKEGVLDDPASVRIGRLESRLAEYDGLIHELERVTKSLVRIAAKRAEDGAAAGAQADGRRHHRKTS